MPSVRFADRLPRPVGEAAIVLGAAAAAAAILTATQYWWLPFGFIGVGAFALLGLLRPALFVGLFLFIRPLMDAFGDNRVGSLASANLAGAAGLLVVAVCVILIAVSPAATRPKATNAFIATLVVSVLAAIHAIVDFGGAKPISELVRLFAIFALYVLAANFITTESGVRKLFLVVGLSAVIPALVGIEQLINGVPTAHRLEVERIHGTFVGPIPFSAFLAVCALLLIALPRDLLNRWIRWPALALILTALVATYTREGWVIFVVGGMLLGWRYHRKLVVLVPLAAVLVIALVPGVQSRVSESESGSTAAPADGAFSSYQWRIDTWSGLLEKYAESPIVGFGLRSVPDVNPRQVGEDPVPRGFDAHHSAIKLLIEGGPVLLVLWVVLLAAVVRTLLRMARERWPWQELARAVLMIWLVIILVGLTTDDPLSATTVMYGLFALTGSLEGAHRSWRREQRPREDVDVESPQGHSNGRPLGHTALPSSA